MQLLSCLAILLKETGKVNIRKQIAQSTANLTGTTYSIQIGREGKNEKQNNEILRTSGKGSLPRKGPEDMEDTLVAKCSFS